MLTSLIVRVVRISMRHAYLVIATWLLLALLSGWYAATHFAINTDVSSLIDSSPEWSARGKAIDAAFPQRSDITLAVVEAPAAEFASLAAHELAQKLAADTQAFSSVSEPGAGAFFEHNGLLFASAKDVDTLTSKLKDSKPLVNRLARDPTLGGLASLLSVTLQIPLTTGQVQLGDMSKLLGTSADTIDAVLAGRPAAMSWRALVDPDTKARSFVEVQPVLDFSALEAGAASSDRIRATAEALHLKERYGASVNLTGPRPLADEEFGSVREGAIPNAIGTLLCVLVILWLAVRSRRMVIAVFATLIVGLVITAAAGLLMVGALNMISVAFAVLFIGIGVDFGIQFGVRYREERHHHGALDQALLAAARSIAMPLALAASATAASFFSFLPTAYRGVSELGQIAGVGILFVAFPSSVTLLPALICVFKPSGERAAPGFHWLAPVDKFTAHYRNPLLIGTLVLVAAGLPLLTHLHFDFNPLDLKDPHTESMRTLQRLADSPEAGVNNVQVLAPSLAAADADAQRLRGVPEVGRVMTLSDFVPADQDAKRAAIADAASQLLPVLDQPRAQPMSDPARVSALRLAAGQLENAALDHPGPGAQQATHLADALRKLAKSDPATRDRADRAIALPLQTALAQLRAALTPQASITIDTLPPDLAALWITKDGHALVDIAPRVAPGANPNDTEMLRRFSKAVLKAEPSVIGGPISILHSADVIVHAFIQAALLALVSITILLWIALRRFGDVLRTLVPLLVSAAVTLEISELIGLRLNFANIIALPLLLGVGVAFKIYYVMAWRAGQTKLLQSSLTQAVILSAGTTAVAFGSLWLSHHPGTSSMGKLLALALLCTLIGAVFFQPVLMGKPRKAARSKRLQRERLRQQRESSVSK
ncbi:MMPL family transporter [Pararobbsia silviterrae]|uniref:RND transporter n=1 Tax=Pararobbsia silviterrae TaxID=1792498 RepID=A0A494X7X0_9BURK|nr:MMPL family transporter [Pararobbsia silviterrae]RKP46560.1 RND transporter [Pararobbsia silviterrae]